jgi:hypothetical protein
MRPSAWVRVLAVALLMTAVVSLLATAAVNGMAAARPPEGVPAKAVAPPPPTAWVVSGQWMTTDEEALDDALGKAREKVQEHLRTQKPPMDFELDATYLRQRLWRDLDPADPAFKALAKNNEKGTEWNLEAAEGKKVKGGHLTQIETRTFDGLGEMRRAAVRVEIDARNKAEFEQQEQQYQVKQREDRATHRQGILVRLLAGLVAVLAAVALYFRLEDATKGYYTTLLRLAAVAFIALVGAGIWLFS